MTQSAFTENLLPLDTSPIVWADRQKPLGVEPKLLRRRKLGELCLLASVSRRDICARHARIVSRVKVLQGCDIFRINDLIKTAKPWQPRAALKYAFSSKPPSPPEEDAFGDFPQEEGDCIRAP